MSRTFNKDRALSIIQSHGPMSIRAWARRCLDDGSVFGPEHHAKAALNSAVGRLGNLARERDDTGLPRMGQTGEKDESGAPLHAPRTLWDMDAYTVNVAERLDLAEENTAIAVALARECRDRYGLPPSDNRLPDLDYGDGTDEDKWR